MPRFDETTLEKRATQVVDRFLREKTALTEGVVDAAQEENLNPEQIKRLVETVNNMAFLKKFEGAPDRMAASEFEPASADAALQQLIDKAGLPGEPTETDNGSNGQNAGVNNDMSTADDLIAALPNTRPDAPRPLPPPDQVAPPPPPLSGAKMAMRLEKIANDLRDARHQAQFRFNDEFQKLATYFTRVGAQPFEQFEQDAFYKWGSAAVPHLGALRAALRKPTATYDHADITKVARVIDSRAPTMTSFQVLLCNADDMIKAAQAEQKAREYQTRADPTVR